MKNFRRENFRGLLTCAAPKDATSPNFAEKTFTNNQKFSPSKVSRYTVYAQYATQVSYRTEGIPLLGDSPSL